MHTPEIRPVDKLTRHTKQKTAKGRGCRASACSMHGRHTHTTRCCLENCKECPLSTTRRPTPCNPTMYTTQCLYNAVSVDRSNASTTRANSPQHWLLVIVSYFTNSHIPEHYYMSNIIYKTRKSYLIDEFSLHQPQRHMRPTHSRE